MVNRVDEHDRNDDPEPPRPDLLEAIWREARPVLDLLGLYATYKHHEGTALATQCLVIMVQFYLDHRK